MGQQQRPVEPLDSPPGALGVRYQVQLDPNRLAAALQRLIVWVQLPGIEPQQLDIRLTGNLLTICRAETEHSAPGQLPPEIVAESNALRDCLQQLMAAARGEHAVLICGETGTGKGLFARALHRHSSRRQQTLVVVDCRALSESVAERLLLGMDRGRRSGYGLLAQAGRGTLLLDDVADLPQTTQKLLARVLRQGCFLPLGARREQRIGFRLLATSNRDLERLATQNRFNAELLQQLSGQRIEIPPLRQRPADIEALTTFLLQRFCQQSGKAQMAVAPECLELLRSYPWPGNVRELENSLGQALLSARGNRTLFPKDLPAHIRVQVKKSALVRQPQAGAAGRGKTLCWRAASDLLLGVEH